MCPLHRRTLPFLVEAPPLCAWAFLAPGVFNFLFAASVPTDPRDGSPPFDSCRAFKNVRVFLPLCFWRSSCPGRGFCYSRGSLAVFSGASEYRFWSSGHVLFFNFGRSVVPLFALSFPVRGPSLRLGVFRVNCWLFFRHFLPPRIPLWTFFSFSVPVPPTLHLTPPPWDPLWISLPHVPIPPPLFCLMLCCACC